MTNIAGFLLNASASGIVHLFTFSAEGGSYELFTLQLKEAMSAAFTVGQEGFGLCPGILGALFGGAPLNGFGKQGAAVTLVILFLISLFFFSNITAETFSSAVSGAITQGKEKLDEGAQNMKQRKEENRRLREEKAQAAEAARIAAEQEAAKKAMDQNFDFDATEIELDPNIDRETGIPLREMRRYYPEDKVFSTPVKATEDPAGSSVHLSSFDFISENGRQPGTKAPQPVAKAISELISAEEKAAPKAPAAESSGDRRAVAEPLPAKAAEAENNELPDGDDDIVMKAVRDADENLMKNIREVENYKEEKKRRDYVLPPIECLNQPAFSSGENFANEMQTTAKRLVEVLASFGVETKLVGISRGPSVTRYELSPAPGVKISKITNLADDIALGLASSGVRIEAPIPNKSAVGIEVPNRSRSTVTLREVISSAEYKRHKDKLLTVALGKDITGNVNVADLSKMPHLLIAGTTGSGKSVCLNCMITSILYNATPSQVKLLMIDPKQVEFTVYNGIPHLLVPVITDARKAAGSLAWAVSEMDNRYKAFSNCGVRDIGGFNKYVQSHPELEPMPQIVIFIDELNDLMMVSPKEVEDSICRLAQKARAAGMHLVVATQRPSVDVITGVIKANIPSRISLSVSSQVDSRTILDCVGAENLLGNGDMLFAPVGVSKPIRIQGAYLSDEEIEKIVTFIKAQENAEYDSEVMDEIERNAVAESGKKKSGSAAASDDSGDFDPLIGDAVDNITQLNSASTTVLQRKLGVGYARAARIMDQLETLGYISPAEGNKPRKVLITRAQYLEMRAGADNPAPSGDYDILSD
ncbi:MAG: DNA translocase FtsK [Oscillospiraceae bacterium]|nr:DNA translocase FtsK [Oscillospiraceae bacterium]